MVSEVEAGIGGAAVDALGLANRPRIATRLAD
jgi:hypothetical protein